MHHGRPSQAVCVHPIEHYKYWNEQFRLETADKQLGPGSVGENWTIEGGNETTVCVGDTYSIGSTEVQVSGPRGPCWKQERKLKLPGFLKRTIESLRTGFYVQVLQCGTVQAGDTWHLKSRPNPWLTVHAVNVCYYQMPEPEMVERILATPELAEGWKRMFGEKVRVEFGRKMVGTRSRASRRRLSDNDIRCSASERRWFPARPAEHVHRRCNNGKDRIQSVLARARGRNVKRRVETCDAHARQHREGTRSALRDTEITEPEPGRKKGTNTLNRR